MSLADLPTLAEVQAERAGRPNWKPGTRLEDRVEATSRDAQQLEQWRRQVRYRDRGRCRVCGCRTLQTLALDPKRGEAHHIVSRTNPTTRYDVRNGLHVCLACHQQFQKHRLFVTGTPGQRFTAGKHTYWDANAPLAFSTDRPAVG